MNNNIPIPRFLVLFWIWIILIVIFGALSFGIEIHIPIGNEWFEKIDE